MKKKLLKNFSGILMILTLCLFFGISIAQAAQLKAQSDQPVTEEELTEEGKVCLAVYDPVCGSDGKTYSNLCELEKAGASLDYYGKCRTDCKRIITITEGPTNNKYWERLGTDPSLEPDILKYKIKWFNGQWSDWYYPGHGDVDWKTNNDGTKRLVWAYFDDHTHKYVKCVRGLPDLVVSKVSISPEKPRQKEDIWVKVEVRNEGDEDASYFSVGLYELLDIEPLSQPVQSIEVSESKSSTAVPGTTKPKMELRIKGLKAGSSITKIFGPFRFSKGSHTIMVKADALNEVDEESETNNEKYESFYVYEEKKEYTLSVRTDKYTYTPGETAIITASVTGSDLSGIDIHASVKSPHSNTWHYVPLKLVGCTGLMSNSCSYIGYYTTNAEGAYTVKAVMSSANVRKEAVTKFFVKEKIIQKYVHLDEKFNLKEGQSAVVVDYKRLRVKLNKVEDFRCVKAPCPTPRANIEVSTLPITAEQKLVKVSSAGVKSKAEVSPVVEAEETSAVKVVEELEKELEIEESNEKSGKDVEEGTSVAVTAQAVGVKGESVKSPTIAPSVASRVQKVSGVGFWLKKGEAKEAFGALITLLEINGDEATLVVTKKKPSVKYVYLNQKFELEEKQEARVIDYNYMRLWFDSVIRTCRSSEPEVSSGACSERASVIVDSPSMGLGTQLYLKPGESKEVFGVISISLLNLDEKSGTFIVEKSRVVIPEEVDVGIEPRAKVVEKGEKAEYTIVVEDKRNVKCPSDTSSNAECTVPPKKYRLRVKGLPFEKEYDEEVELSGGETKKLSLVVDTSEPYIVVAYKTMTSTGVEEQVAEEVKVSEESAENTEAVKTSSAVKLNYPRYKFSVSVSDEKGNVLDTAFATLYIKSRVEPPEFPTDKEEIRLHKGWNLVSLPGRLVKFLPSECTATKKLVAFVYLKDEQRYVTMQEARHALGERFYEYLAENAFWVYSYEDCSLVFQIRKEASYNEISLTPGWNLVPVSEDIIGKSVTEETTNCEFEKLYKWDAESQSWERITSDYVFTKNDLNKGFLAKASNYCEFGGELVIISPPAMPE